MPWHLSAFHPAGEVVDRPATPPATLRRAREDALAAGMQHVYTGNIRDPEGGRTNCPGCGAILVERDGYHVRSPRVTAEGKCPECDEAIAGVWS